MSDFSLYLNICPPYLNVALKVCGFFIQNLQDKTFDMMNNGTYKVEYLKISVSCSIISWIFISLSDFSLYLNICPPFLNVALKVYGFVIQNMQDKTFDMMNNGASTAKDVKLNV